MPKISTKWVAAELKKLRQSNTMALIHLTKELKNEQPLIYMEIVSLAQEGATEEEIAGMIRYLTFMQHAATELGMGQVVTDAEYRRAIRYAYDWFGKMEEGGASKITSRIGEWVADVALDDEPWVWTACLEFIKDHKHVQAKQYIPIIATMHSIAYVFSWRFGEMPEP